MSDRALVKNLEAILFWKSEPLKLSYLTKILDKNDEEIKDAIDSIKAKMNDSGIVLIEVDDTYALGTTPDAKEVLDKVAKNDITGELSRAALETLSIVLYRGPISKIDIDYLRGVNSYFILRNLLVRGLVEKEVNSKDQRTFIYKPSVLLLSYLGIRNISDLPEYEEYASKIRASLEDKMTEE